MKAMILVMMLVGCGSEPAFETSFGMSVFIDEGAGTMTKEQVEAIGNAVVAEMATMDIDPDAYDLKHLDVGVNLVGPDFDFGKNVEPGTYGVTWGCGGGITLRYLPGECAATSGLAHEMIHVLRCFEPSFMDDHSHPPEYFYHSGSVQWRAQYRAAQEFPCDPS